MGTRNVIIVKTKGKTKIAQYGQWDGYPTGQGQDIADFLKTANLKLFRKQVQALEAYTTREANEIWRKGGMDDDSGLIEQGKAQVVGMQYPELNRDTGAKILGLVHEGKVKKVQLSEDFKNDSVWCEYWYEIDLDKETIVMNGSKPYTFKEWTRKGKMEQLER